MRIRNPACFLAPLLFLILSASCVNGQPQVADGGQQFADFGDFKLQNGSVILGFHLGYRTLGKLNADRSKMFHADRLLIRSVSAVKIDCKMSLE